MIRQSQMPATSPAVYTCKQPSNGRWVQDYERGVGGGISPYPWQTDTSIGDWFYNKHWKYQQDELCTRPRLRTVDMTL